MIHLLDTTLREGVQTVGVTFSLKQKKKIVDGLAMIGVSELEIGIASPLVSDLPEVMEYCRRRYPALTTSLWCRCRKEDILYAASLAVDRLSLSLPVSDLLLTKKLEKDRKWAERTLRSALLLARSKGIQVSVGFEDATRADLSFLLHLAELAEHGGAFRIRLADTVGIATPTHFANLIRTIKKAGKNCEIGVHTHNDFGMATGNAITAAETGAEWIDVTVLGLGERSGCTRLEEVAGYLGIMGICPGIQVEHLKPLAEYVSKITGKDIEDCRPLLGEKIFTCETGLHLHGLQMDHSTYEPFPPEQIGATRRLLFGSKCGRAALRMKLTALGVDPTQGISLNKIRSFRSQALLNRTFFNEKDILALASQTG